MSKNNSQNVYMTSPNRVGRMLLIMLGVCLIGGIIFFSMWDYWISQPPPVVALMAGEKTHAGPAEATGQTITQNLSFLESADFRSLTFNALKDEPGVNPTIEMSVGDKIVFDVVNDGMSFHAFGVTQDTEGFAGVIPGSEIAAPTNPLKPGESGTSEFIAGEEGTYYYICTVPGHRDQGMVGEIIVSGSSGPAVAAAPTGVSHEFELDFIESADFRTLAFDALPGEEGNNPQIIVNSGDEVTITTNNAGMSFHAFGVVSNPDDFNSVIFDSAIAAATNPLKPGESGSTTFTAGAPGTYHYICTVPGHALQGMIGEFIVE
ncbi:MAG: plastocyanin/azurin family copper-binding protein [Nitrosopumilus sp.]|jgi:nitrite reductase (NO-forming)|nr:multicopper oxidase domain-containing protein [Nitrosopumilus sp.]MDC4229193.1 plastocyanin/azurin family copper-binding protein [Nitrosopumilus sp.]MDC4230007.1 plastocyanin/azurin family copper-binding protein [Nitrosopumilus sp.]